MSKIQFRRSAVVLAVSMMAAGGAFAVDPITGNTLVGPAITSGAATVNINQVGVDNVVSATGDTTGAALVVDNSGTSAAGKVDLTIQQVGGINKLGLTAYTSGITKIRVFQGGEARGPGGTGGVANVTKDIGVDGSSTGNAATITLGTSGPRAGASEILLSQQGDLNKATLALGSTAFTGVMQVIQKGNLNTADITVSDQTASNKTFNIGQAGNGNTLLLTAGDIDGNVTANFGGVNFGDLATSSNPTANDGVGNNNAKTYVWNIGTNVADSGVASSTAAGINLGSTAGFNLLAFDGGNKVQVDLATAATSSKVDVYMQGSGNTLALYGASGLVNMGGANRVAVNGNGLTLAAYAGAGSTVNVNDVTFQGNGYFSATGGSTISVTEGTVTASGMSVLQTGAAHQATINGTTGSASWKITQDGTVGVNAVDLTNTATNANWTVAQSGTGAMMLAMTNATPNGVINVSQSGDANHTATGINFAATSGSFTLAQK